MSNECILVVDDEARMRKLIKDFLVAKGFQILEAEDGEKALEVYETNKCKNCKECWYSKNRIVKELDIIEKIIEMCKEVNNEKK